MYLKKGKGEIKWTEKISRQDHRACQKPNDDKEQFIYLKKKTETHEHYVQEKIHHAMATEATQVP